MIGDEIRTAYHEAKWAVALRGLLGITVGVLIIARPLGSLAAFALVIALWSFADGFTSIVRSFQMRDVAPHWWVLLLGGIVSVLFGIAAVYYYPTLSLTFAVLWTSYWLIFSGVVATYVSVQERRAQMAWGWTMAFGVVAIAGGILALAYPDATLATLLGVMATFGLVGGALLLMGSFRMQSAENDLNRTIRRATAA